MHYTLLFIFDEPLNQVLLVNKNRGPYPNCLNGVGGKLELSDPSPTHGALRELREETGITREQLLKFNPLVTLNFPSGTELHVFYGVLKSGFNFTQIEDEPLGWFPLSDTLNVSDTRFAGEGKVPYFINASLVALRE
jgi:8-oxo-dGTP pyrophosphatase MutT (NUDIX family)